MKIYQETGSSPQSREQIVVFYRKPGLVLAAASLALTACAGSTKPSVPEVSSNYDSLIEMQLEAGPIEAVNCRSAIELGSGAPVERLALHFPEMNPVVSGDFSDIQHMATLASANRINEDVAQPDDAVIACESPELTALATDNENGKPIYIAWNIAEVATPSSYER